MNQMNQEIMKKVRTIYIARKLIVPSALFAAAAVMVALTVSVPNVVMNVASLSGAREMAFYLADSFAHTESYVQGALVAGLIFLVFVLRGAVQSMLTASSLSGRV